MHFGQRTFCGLYQADAVLAVGRCSLQTLDLCLHLLTDCQTGCVITCTVDLVTRGQLLQALGNLGVVHAQLTVGVQRHNVASYYHSHGMYLLVLSAQPSLAAFLFSRPFLSRSLSIFGVFFQN